MWSMALIASRRHIWRLELDLPPQSDASVLHVLLLRACRRSRLLGMVREAVLNHTSLTQIPEVEVHHTPTIELRTCPAARWEVDGEVESGTPISAHIQPAGLRLIVPG